MEADWQSSLRSASRLFCCAERSFGSNNVFNISYICHEFKDIEKAYFSASYFKHALLIAIHGA
jgi:hypothetical protein